MKFFSWLLSNVILILVVLALTYTYVYWDEPLGEGTPVGDAMTWLEQRSDTASGLVARVRSWGGKKGGTPTQSPSDVEMASAAETSITDSSATELSAAGLSTAEPSVSESVEAAKTDYVDAVSTSASAAITSLAGGTNESSEASVSATEMAVESTDAELTSADSTAAKSIATDSTGSGVDSALTNEFVSTGAKELVSNMMPEDQSASGELSTNAASAEDVDDAVVVAESTVDKSQADETTDKDTALLSTPGVSGAAVAATEKGVDMVHQARSETSAAVNGDTSADASVDNQEPIESAPIVNDTSEMVSNDEVATNEETDEYVTPELERSLSVVPEINASKKSDDSDEAEQSLEDLWIAARRSFYRRDYENSVKYYETLIERDKDAYDAHGELGNVYFNQGKMKQAASSYYDAAAVLVRLGQVDRAASLQRLLGRMDRAKAEELRALIASVQQ